MCAKPFIFGESKIWRLEKGLIHNCSYYVIFVFDISLYGDALTLPPPPPPQKKKKKDFLDCSKLKEFADDDFKFDENGGSFSKRVEKTGKRRICS